MIAVVVELLSDICLATAALGCLYLLVAAAAVLRLPRARAGGQVGETPSAAEPVTILKPLRGGEPDLLRRLVGFCRQDYSGPVQVVCGVADRADPAVGFIEFIRARHPAVDLVVNSRRHGLNPKVSNLINMLPHARHDVLIMADSDVDVGRDYVRNVMAQLHQPGTGAVSCLYRGIAAGGLCSRLSALAINSHFLPNAVLAISLGLTQPCFGATIALKRSTLRRIGGFEAFKDMLADDNAMGQAVRAIGLAVAIPDFVVGHVCHESTWRELLAHDLRIARTIKSVDRVGYCGLVITHPFALALLALPYSGADAAMMAGLAFACRLVLCLCVEQVFKFDMQRYWLLPLRDLLSFTTFVWGLFGNSVNWRGATYHVTGDGRLMADRRHA
jgi:ceramide glucosyltransferase